MTSSVSLQGITKRFPAVTANDHIDFDCNPGEIHALLGENGAGKTTLMKILYGMVKPDEGKIYIDGREVQISSPRDALRLGIGMIHQHFMLIPQFSVVENVILGVPPAKGPFVDEAAAFDKVCSAAQKYGLVVDPMEKVENLSVSGQQRVEILRLLYRGAKILILDEPTAVLAPKEIRELFSILRGLAQASHSVIFITHKLKEAMEISDRITVLRAGKVVSTRPVAEATARVLAKEMVGRDLREDLLVSGSTGTRPVLQVKGVTAHNDQGSRVLNGIDVEIHAGEIVGVAGVDGNGQTELAQVLTGLRSIDTGHIEVDGKNLSSSSPEEFILSGVAHVPEDRQKDGLVLEFTLEENLILQQHARQPFAACGLINKAQIRKFAQDLINKFDVRPPKPEIKAKMLSGGNQQKLIIARELSREPKLLVASHPTRGLDVGSVEYIQSQLIKERDRGCAILLISHDLDELFQLSDRLAVIYRGKFVALLPAQQATVEEIGLLMTGSLESEAGDAEEPTGGLDSSSPSLS